MLHVHESLFPGCMKPLSLFERGVQTTQRAEQCAVVSGPLIRNNENGVTSPDQCHFFSVSRVLTTTFEQFVSWNQDVAKSVGRQTMSSSDVQVKHGGHGN